MLLSEEKIDKIRLWVPKYFRYNLYSFFLCSLYLVFAFGSLIGTTPLSCITWFAFAYVFYINAKHSYYSYMSYLFIGDLIDNNVYLKMEILRLGINITDLNKETDRWWKEESRIQKERNKYNEGEEENKLDINIGGPAGSH